MAQFNALTEPWIPVRMPTGEKKEVGILELLENAHHMEAISDASPLLEYGMYRLMTVFLMDALAPESQQDIEDLLEEGAFDMECIHDYVNRCERDGPCFDLFDKQRPFLQSTYDVKWDKTVKPVSVMFHELPRGHNPVHFTHKFETEYVLCPAVCLKALCAVNVFCTAGLQGPSSINGAPPLYIMVKGDNLFESLVLNMIPRLKTNLPYQSPPPVWRGLTDVEPGKKLSETSLLSGMTMLARRTNLIADERGGICSLTGKDCPVVVRYMYFQKGIDFVGYESWRDPHVIYAVSDKGRYSLKPQLGKESWRNIGSMFECDDQRAGADVVRQYLDIFEDFKQVIPYVTYGLVTTQAQYESWLRDEAAFDMRIAKSRDRMQCIRSCIDLTEKIAGILKRQLKMVFVHFGGEVIEQAVGGYYAQCRQYFFAKLCPDLAQAYFSQPGVVDAIMQDWSRMLSKQAYSAFEGCADRLGIDGKYLMKRAEAQIGLIKSIKKVLERRE